MKKRSGYCAYCRKPLPNIKWIGKTCNGDCGRKYIALTHKLREAITGRAAAHKAVTLAIRHGKLQKITDGTQCVDCGKPAKLYDHRDYGKHLDVEPVCISCNRNRGTALYTVSAIHHVFTFVLRGPQRGVAA